VILEDAVQLARRLGFRLRRNLQRLSVRLMVTLQNIPRAFDLNHWALDVGSRVLAENKQKKLVGQPKDGSAVPVVQQPYCLMSALLATAAHGVHFWYGVQILLIKCSFNQGRTPYRRVFRPVKFLPHILSPSKVDVLPGVGLFWGLCSAEAADTRRLCERLQVLRGWSAQTVPSAGYANFACQRLSDQSRYH
jgi:hypothetical protein